MTYTVRPISDRTPFAGVHRYSQFQSSWRQTEQLLLAEVKHLSGRDLVLELDVREQDLRLDGTLRANARPSSPAVRVAFGSKHGPLTYATDRFNSWCDNARAIALGLEALRKVDRYGITKRGEQYTGWKAIEAPHGMTTLEAQELLCHTAKIECRPNLSWAAVHRKARFSAHPDRHGGDQTLWDQVEEAARVLRVTS